MPIKNCTQRFQADQLAFYAWVRSIRSQAAVSHKSVSQWLVLTVLLHVHKNITRNDSIILKGRCRNNNDTILNLLLDMNENSKLFEKLSTLPYTLIVSEDETQRYCRSLLLLRMCLTILMMFLVVTAHSKSYWRSALTLLHIFPITAHPHR